MFMDISTLSSEAMTYIGIMTAVGAVIGSFYQIWRQSKKEKREAAESESLIKKQNAEAEEARSATEVNDLSATANLLQTITYLMKVMEDTRSQIRQDLIKSMADLKDSINASRIVMMDKLSSFEESLSDLKKRVERLEGKSDED